MDLVGPAWNSVPAPPVSEASNAKCEGKAMSEQKANELLRKHNITPDDVKERRTSLHHLRHIVRSEELPFEVFKALVKMRR